MSTTPAELRADALRYERRAADATAAADTLARQHGYMERRLEAALRLHTEDVWTSRAATASRMNLMISGTGQLGRARTDLWTLVEGLRRRATDLENAAAGFRRRAAALDAEAAAAGTAYLPPHLQPPGYEPPTPAPTGPAWGIR
ncbi:MAG: hypothetical protein AAGE98_19530 [Actinomycetota bacterium]